MALQDITTVTFNAVSLKKKNAVLSTILLYVQEKCLQRNLNYMTRQSLYLPGVLKSVTDTSGFYEVLPT
jgi:hypothetical protein